MSRSPLVLSDGLYEAAHPIWEAQLSHPFVRGMADGTLEDERFKRWVRQDYLYLIEFARVFAWAAAKADSLETMSWYAAALDLTLNTEMDLHRRQAERLGVSPQELEREQMWPTTRAYTDFLVRTAADGDMLDLLAALLPCVWGYVYLGQRLAAGAQPVHPKYAEWVNQYSSPEFVAAAQWLRAELDRLGAGIRPARRQRLIQLFVTSSRYEWRFWQMCWQGEEWAPEVEIRVAKAQDGRVSQGPIGTIRPLVAAAIRNDDRLLVWEDHNPATGEVVSLPLTGGIEFGETGEQALIRELHEEIGGIVARADYLGMIEDIFDWNHQKRHEIYLIYDVELADRAIYDMNEVPVVEPDGTRYVARWRRLREFRSTLRLVPDGLLHLLERRAG